MLDLDLQGSVAWPQPGHHRPAAGSAAPQGPAASLHPQPGLCPSAGLWCPCVPSPSGRAWPQARCKPTWSATAGRAPRVSTSPPWSPWTWPAAGWKPSRCGARAKSGCRAASIARECACRLACTTLHTDNGAEFINRLLYPYCVKHAIKLSRGRPYKKNDQAYVEQKNWFVVRKTVGYDRFASKAALRALAEVYEPLRLYMNFFQPLRKVVSKERVGAKVRKRYDTARTPYQRLLASGVLDEADQERLRQPVSEPQPVATAGGDRRGAGAAVAASRARARRQTGADGGLWISGQPCGLPTYPQTRRLRRPLSVTLLLRHPFNLWVTFPIEASRPTPATRATVASRCEKHYT